MIAALWHRLTAALRPKPKPTPFVREMRTYRAEAVTQTRESVRAQRRDRARHEVLPLETGLFAEGDDCRGDDA